MMQAPHHRARRVALLVWCALLLCLVAWQASPGMAGFGPLVLAVTAGPLLPPLPGLWRGRRRTLRWAPMTLVPALAWSLTEMLVNPAARGFAVGAALLAFLALAAIVATLRSMPPSS